MPHSIDIGYNYQPLNPSKREIRLLWVKFQPHYDHTPLKCRLEHRSLDDIIEKANVNWSAISYSWGKDTQLRPANIDGQQVWVPDSADAALRNCLEDFAMTDAGRSWTRVKHLVRKSEFIFWIDVVCIDQTNIQERNAQVQLMGGIYSSAPAVLIWLGSGEDEHARILHDVFVRFNKSLESMPELQDEPETYLRNLSTVGQETFSSLTNKELGALDSLYSSLWFSRTWIMQEVILPNGHIICLKGRWAFLWDGVWELPMAIRVTGTSASSPWLDKLTLAAQAGMLHACRIGQARQHRSLSRLLALTAQTECAEPRDKVFSLLGMLVGGIPAEVKIDYDVPLAELFIATTRLAIKQDQSVEILRDTFTRAPIGDKRSSEVYPSWVVPCHWPQMITVNRVEYGRGSKARNIVDRLYDANVGDGNMLSVKGVILDEIGSRSAMILRYNTSLSTEQGTTPTEADYIERFKETMNGFHRVWNLAKSARPLQDETSLSRELCSVLFHTNPIGNLRIELDYEVFKKLSIVQQNSSGFTELEQTAREGTWFNDCKATLMEAYLTSLGRYLVDTSGGRIASAWPGSRPGDKI